VVKERRLFLCEGVRIHLDEVEDLGHFIELEAIAGADLERAGLICHVDARSAPRRLWFLSERGAELAVEVGELGERPKLLGPSEAAGPLRAHTIAVNEVYLLLENRNITVEQRFVELDRATLSIDRLVSELVRYAQLDRASAKGKILWRYRYPSFPPIICVLARLARRVNPKARRGAHAARKRPSARPSGRSARRDHCA
jgi:hypothetical protein